VTPLPHASLSLRESRGRMVEPCLHRSFAECLLRCEGRELSRLQAGVAALLSELVFAPFQESAQYQSLVSPDSAGALQGYARDEGGGTTRSRKQSGGEAARLQSDKVALPLSDVTFLEATKVPLTLT